MNLQENGYMVFPRWFIQNMAEYPHPAQVCYLWLYSQAEWNQESEAFGTLETSVRDVGEATGYDSSAVSGAMNVLEGSKLIEWTRGKGRYSKSRIRIVDFFTPKTYVPLSAQKDSKSLPLDIDNSKSLPLVLPLGIDNGQSNSNPPEQPMPIDSPEPLEHEEHVEHKEQQHVATDSTNSKLTTAEVSKAVRILGAGDSRKGNLRLSTLQADYGLHDVRLGWRHVSDLIAGKDDPYAYMVKCLKDQWWTQERVSREALTDEEATERRASQQALADLLA